MSMNWTPRQQAVLDKAKRLLAEHYIRQQVRQAMDAEWDESKHPRADNGQFGSGGQSASKQETDRAEPIPEDIGGFLGKEYRVKGQAAIKKLIAEQHGHAKGAFYREGIGDIDLVWGNDDVGLKHIIKRRTEQGIDVGSFLSDLDEVIAQGNAVRNRQTGNFEIWHKGKMAVISPEFKGNRLIFLLTAFKSRKQKTNP